MLKSWQKIVIMSIGRTDRFLDRGHARGARERERERKKNEMKSFCVFCPSHFSAPILQGGNCYYEKAILEGEEKEKKGRKKKRKK